MLEAVLVFAVNCALFWWFFGIDSLPLGSDAYFHYTAASLPTLAHPAPGINALPFTLLGAEGPDHHWLIHWLQKPLVVLFDDTAANIANVTIVWAAMVPTILCFILRSYSVPYASILAMVGIWGLFLLPDRLLMFRAQNAAIIMVVGLALLMSARRYLWVGVFIFLFNHAYMGVILAGAVGFAALVAHAVVYRQFDRPLISASAVGLILSLLTSPWFPDNIRYFLIVTLGRLLSPTADISLMGIEWLPLGPLTLLKLGLVGHICLLLSGLALAMRWRASAGTPQLKLAVLFTVLTCVFLLLYSRHWRMGEFCGPLSAISLGFCLALFAREGKKLVTLAVLSVLVMTGVHQYYKRPKVDITSSRYRLHCQYLNQ